MDCSLETSAFAVSYSEGRENPNAVRRNRPSFVRYHRKVLPQNVRQVLNSIIIKRNGFVMNTRLLLGALATAAVLASPAHAKLDGKVPEPGMVTFVTFSADGCQPCRLMEPALRKLDQEYEGRAAIREINTSEYPELVPYFRIAAVPTQILFDKDGKELGWRSREPSRPLKRSLTRRRPQSSRQDPLLPLSVSPDGRLKDEDKGQLKGRRMLNPRPFVHSTECENGRPPAWRTPVSIWTFGIRPIRRPAWRCPSR